MVEQVRGRTSPPYRCTNVTENVTFSKLWRAGGNVRKWNIVFKFDKLDCAHQLLSFFLVVPLEKSRDKWRRFRVTSTPWQRRLVLCNLSDDTKYEAPVKLNHCIVTSSALYVTWCTRSPPPTPPTPETRYAQICSWCQLYRGIGKHAGGTLPTGRHSCFSVYLPGHLSFTVVHLWNLKWSCQAGFVVCM